MKVLARRRFIRTVLLTTGAVFTEWRGARAAAGPVLASSSLKFREAHRVLRDGAPIRFPTPSRSVEVAVIGAGPAGLAAAWKLLGRGRDVLLLENEPVVGGSARTATVGGTLCPLGSTYFYQYGGEIREFLDAIGFRPVETSEDAQLFGGEPVTDWWNPKNINHLPIPESDRAAFRKFRDILLALQPVPQYPLSSARPELIAEYDAMSAAAFVGRFGSRLLAERMDLFARSVLGAPLAEVNAYAFINFYSGEFGDAYGVPCYTAPSGLSAVSSLAASAIGTARIETETLVSSVENRPDGRVEIHAIDRSGRPAALLAGRAVVAVEKRIARRMVRGILAAQDEAMSRIRYAPYVTILLRCRAPLFPAGTFDCWIPDREGRFTDMVDVRGMWGRATEGGVSAERPTYLLFCPRPESERTALQDESRLLTFAQSAAHALEDYFPHADGVIDEMHVFCFGHSMVVPAVGSHMTLARPASAPCGNIEFIGTDNDLAPGFENALLSGLRLVG